MECCIQDTFGATVVFLKILDDCAREIGLHLVKVLTISTSPTKDALIRIYSNNDMSHFVVAREWE